MAKVYPGKFTPLRDLRRKSNLTQREVVERGMAICPDFPDSEAHLSMLENRGTKDADIIEALAAIFGKSYEEIKEICRQTRISNKELVSA